MFDFTLLLWLATGEASAQSRLDAIGPFPDGTGVTEAAGLSADGRVIIGAHWRTRTAYRWTPEAGVAEIAGMQNPTAVSADGQTVVGTTYTEQGTRAVIWTPAAGLQTYAQWRNEDVSGRDLRLISGDGRTLAGRSFVYYRGTAEYTLSITGPSSNPVHSRLTAWEPRALNRDGMVVVGSAMKMRFSDPTHHFGEAFLLRLPSYEMVFLDEAGTFHQIVVDGDLSQAPGLPSYRSWANAVTPDGKVAVGVRHLNSGPPHWVESHMAFRWVPETGGMEYLGSLPGPAVDSRAHAVSAAGAVVVGVSQGRAFYWRAGSSMRELRDVLLSYGLGTQTQGWTFDSAEFISHDGLTIVGLGRYNGLPRVWRAHLVPPNRTPVPWPF